MTKNPVINAAGAAGYITLVVSVITALGKTQKNKPDTFFAPILALSMLVLSVTVMAYIFFYQPLMLFLKGKKIEAVNLFIQTVGVFAAITATELFLVFSGII